MRMLNVVRFTCLLAVCYLVGCSTLAQSDMAEADRELAEQTILATQRAQGTPAQEVANRMQYHSMQNYIKMLKREMPADEAVLAKARRKATEVRDRARMGPTWPAPPKLDVPRASGAINLDGNLEEPDWQRAATVVGTFEFYKQQADATVQTTWRLLWDERFLYIAFECDDVDLIAPPMSRDSSLWDADCIEAFILPNMRTRTYWEVIVSPSGSVFDALQHKKPKEWGLISGQGETMKGLQFGISLRGTLNQPGDTDEGYTVELAIPFDELPEYKYAKPAVGRTLHLMLCRINRTGEQVKNYAFCPLMSWGHNIWNHAAITLAE